MKSEKSKFETNRMKSEKTMETQQNKIMTGHLPKYIDVFYPILILVIYLSILMCFITF